MAEHTLQTRARQVDDSFEGDRARAQFGALFDEGAALAEAVPVNDPRRAAALAVLRPLRAPSDLSTCREQAHAVLAAGIELAEALAGAATMEAS